MRKAITFLQSAASLYGTAGITPERVLEISGVYPDSKVADAVNTLRTGSFDAVRNSARTIISQGYGLTGVLEKVRVREFQGLNPLRAAWSRCVDRQRAVVGFALRDLPVLHTHLPLAVTPYHAAYGGPDLRPRQRGASGGESRHRRARGRRGQAPGGRR